MPSPDEPRGSNMPTPSEPLTQDVRTARPDAGVDARDQSVFAVRDSITDILYNDSACATGGGCMDANVTRIVDSYYAELQQMGGSRWDTSSLIARLEKK